MLQSLRGRHVVFIGDSLSRYMYLVLAHFLVRDEWPEDPPFSPGNSAKDRTRRMHESVCFEKSWPPPPGLGNYSLWNAFYNGSNRLLQPYELCDCYRRLGSSGMSPYRDFTENRFLEKAGVRISFFTQIQSPAWQLHGHTPPGSHEEMRARLSCGTGACSEEPSWRMSLTDFAARALPALGATDVVFNAGHFWYPGSQPQLMAQLFGAMANATAGRGRAVWRTTTATDRWIWSNKRGATSMTGGPLASESTNRLARSRGLDVVDLQSVTKQLKQLPKNDAMNAWVVEKKPTHCHFFCAPYRELVLLIISALVDPPAPPARR